MVRPSASVIRFPTTSPAFASFFAGAGLGVCFCANVPVAKRSNAAINTAVWAKVVLTDLAGNNRCFCRRGSYRRQPRGLVRNRTTKIIVPGDVDQFRSQVRRGPSELTNISDAIQHVARLTRLWRPVFFKIPRQQMRQAVLVKRDSVFCRRALKYLG